MASFNHDYYDRDQSPILSGDGSDEEPCSEFNSGNEIESDVVSDKEIREVPRRKGQFLSEEHTPGAKGSTHTPVTGTTKDTPSVIYKLLRRHKKA